MKTFLIATAALVSTTALAQQTPTGTASSSSGPTPEQIDAAKALLMSKTNISKPAEITPEMEPYMPAIKSSASIITEIASILQGVTDKESADAAAPKVAAAIAKMKEVKQSAKDIPLPSPELQAKLQPVIMQYMSQPVQQFTVSVMTVAASQAYGSEALMKALEELGNAQ